ncbi:MAG: Vps62-related protein [Candidatus Bathyarchaeota archaeon]|nr:Vps62-related protein [Candidatus Bathyarchaeota archaeon]
MLKKTSQHLRHSRFKLRHFGLAILTLSLFLAAFAILAFQQSARAQTDEDLAATYAPVLHFTSGEKFYPTSVDYIIESSVLKQRNSDGTSSIIDSSPRLNTLGTHTSSNLFLDNKLGTFEAIAADYAADAASTSYYAYVNVARSSSLTVIQYWLFYIFNNGPMNDHQGDIEVIQVFLDASGNPQTVLASQHGAGQNAAWSDVEKSDTHPVIYVAQGSHANYFRSYQGKMGIENDIVGSDGKTISANQLTLVQLNSQSWLNFKGRWGYWGTDAEVALGRAGPLGPKYNQDGVRWSQPSTYLASTFHVDGAYFILAWLVANFLLLLAIYIVARSAWKIYCIAKLQRKGGLLVGKFLKGRGGIGLIIGIVAIVVTVAALFVPWYSVTASSEAGPLAQQGGVTLVNVDGVNGVTVNLFLGADNADSTSGYVSLFSAMLPFAIIIAAGVILLTLDVIGVRSGRKLGLKLIISMVGTLLPVIFIIVLISQLSALVPFAAGLLPGQTVPSQVESMVRSISSSPIGGTTSSQFPVVGVTTVNWGLGIGAYLLIVAAVLRIVGGFIMYTAPELQRETQLPPAPPPPPPPPA